MLILVKMAGYASTTELTSGAIVNKAIWDQRVKVSYLENFCTDDVILYGTK